MQRLSLLALIFITWNVAAADAQTITFRMDPVPVGTSVEAVDSMLLDLDYTVAEVTDDVTFYAPYRKRKVYTRTPLEIEAGRVSTFRLQFSEAFESRDWPGKESAVMRAPVTQAAYIVTHAGSDDPSAMDRSAVEEHRMVLISNGTITRADGETMKPAEEAYLRDEAFEGMEFTIGHLLEGRTMNVGQTLRPGDDVLGTLETGFVRGKVMPKDLQLTLEEIERMDGRRIANFEMTLRIEGAAGDMKLGADIKGFLRVDENGWLHSLVLSGTVVGSGTYDATPVSADGTVEGIMTRTYVGR